MYMKQLIENVVVDTGATETAVKRIVASALRQITATLAAGEEVRLPEFGTFEVRDRAEHVCRNPKTGEPITVPAMKVAVYKPAKAVKDALNGTK